MLTVSKVEWTETACGCNPVLNIQNSTRFASPAANDFECEIVRPSPNIPSRGIALAKSGNTRAAPVQKTARAQAVQVFFPEWRATFRPCTASLFPLLLSFFLHRDGSRGENGSVDRPASFRSRNFISTVPRYPRLVSPCRGRGIWKERGPLSFRRGGKRRNDGDEAGGKQCPQSREEELYAGKVI